MGHHVGVLERRVEPGSVGRHGARDVGERRRDERRQAGEEGRDPAEDGGDPRHELAVALAVLAQRERRRPGQDRQPQEQRPGLAGPERAQRVAGGEPPAGVLGDHRQREVVGHEGVLDGHDRHQRRRERGGEGVARAPHEAAIAPPAGQDPGDARVDGQREDEVEGDAAERRHRAARRIRLPSRPTSTCSGIS